MTQKTSSAKHGWKLYIALWVSHALNYSAYLSKSREDRENEQELFPKASKSLVTETKGSGLSEHI